MASSSVRNHPNFAVICSFLQRYGEHLRLPDLTIPELEEVLEETNAVGHGLKELIITLMKRVVNSIKPDRWEKHLIKLIDNYHSPVDAWELESLGFSLCKLETKLSILKYLCETQFDDNPKFKNIVNKETPEEQKIKPIGRDKLGLVYWFQKDHDCNIRIYREEQDDIDETSWQTIGRGRDDLANLITELKVAYGAKLPLDSLESSRSATPILTNGEANAVKPESSIGTTSTTKEGAGVVNDADISGAKDDVKSEDCTKSVEVKTEGESKKEIKNERCENTEDCEAREEKPILSAGLDVNSEHKKEEDGKETVTSQVQCKKEGALNLQEEQKTGAQLISGTDDRALKSEGREEGTVESVGKEEKDADEKLETVDSESEKKKLGKESSLQDLKSSGNEEGESVNEKIQRDENAPVEKAGVKVEGKVASEHSSVPTGDNEAEKKQKIVEGGTEEGEGCVKEQFALEEKDSERSSESITEKSVERIKRHDEMKGADEEGGVVEEGGEVKKDSRREQKENGDTSVTLQTQDDIKNLSKGEKLVTKKAKERTATEESPEMGWSRRRLRVRKPPPKKEEEVVVQEKPKKKVKEGNKTAKSGDEVVKKREKKKKKKETESEEEIEEQEEESEEIEEDNTSDEDFILANIKTKNSSADTAPPVVKARTAKSKKSKGSSKKVEPEELSDEPCIKCGNYNHPDQILLCDSCDAGYHTACLRPPLMYVPDGQWFCPACEHMALLKNLEATLEVVDSELKVIRQKNRKKQDKYKWLLTEVCSANILPEDSSVLITKRIERVEKPERPRHERTRPKPRKVARAFIEEPDEIEYIQRRSGRNRKQISYKFEEFDSAINTAIHDEVEEKRKAKAQEEQTGFGRSRGKDMSTIEAATWEEEEEEHASRKKKKKLNDLDATSEEEDDESDEFRVNNESCSDEDFIVEGDEELQETEEEEELVMSSMSDSGSEYGRRRKRGSKKKKKVPLRSRDLGPVRRSSRNLGRERKVYQDSTSSESDEERPRDAWRMNPIITARRQRESDAEFSEESHERKRKRRQASSQDSGDDSKDDGKHSKKSSPSNFTKEGSKKRKKKKDRKVSSSSEEDEDEGYVQPKRKFRIDSDDSNGSDEDRGEDSQDKEWKDGSEDGNDRTKRKLTVRNTLRGMCSKRVDYRKMAEGSSSEEEDLIEEGEGSEGDRRDDFDSEKVKHEGKASGVNDDFRITGNVREEERVDGTSLLTGNVNQNNSAAADDDSLSPISDLDDLKENGSFSSEKVQTISGDKIDKRSTEDDDDLEGVTDIFDYLSKD